MLWAYLYWKVCWCSKNSGAKMFDAHITFFQQFLGEAAWIINMDIGEKIVFKETLMEFCINGVELMVLLSECYLASQLRRQ